MKKKNIQKDSKEQSLLRPHNPSEEDETGLDPYGLPPLTFYLEWLGYVCVSPFSEYGCSRCTQQRSSFEKLAPFVPSDEDRACLIGPAWIKRKRLYYSRVLEARKVCPSSPHRGSIS